MGDFVVTGASGFIGEALCAVLTERGHNVIAVSRDRGYRSPNPHIRTCTWEFLSAGADTRCVHLAEANLSDEVARDPARSAQAAERLARQLLSLGFRKIVYVSSAAVYGDLIPLPHFEDSPTNPRSPYGALKLKQEALFTGEHIVARVSNVYGPRMSAENVISRILAQLRNDGDKIQLRELAAIRDYIFVTDVAKALAELAASDLSGVYNVSTGIGTSVAQLVSLIGEIESRRLTAAATQTTGAASSLILSPEKLKRTLGWQPLIELRAGLTGLAHQMQ